MAVVPLKQLTKLPFLFCPFPEEAWGQRRQGMVLACPLPTSMSGADIPSQSQQPLAQIRPAGPHTDHSNQSKFSGQVKYICHPALGKHGKEQKMSETPLRGYLKLNKRDAVWPTKPLSHATDPCLSSLGVPTCSSHGCLRLKHLNFPRKAVSPLPNPVQL